MSLFVDIKYVSLVSIRLEKFKKKSDKLFVFRCPYCGDSKKDKNKTRGYLYINKDHISYKCHNCAVSTSLSNFLNHIDTSLGGAYKLEKFMNNVTLLDKIVVKVEPPKPITNPLIDCGLIPLDKMDTDHRVVQYANSRKLPSERFGDLYYAKDMRQLEKLNKLYEGRILAEERLVIPYYDRQGNLSGVTGRALGSNKLRYINIRLTDYPMIYGMKYLDQSKPIYVLEGAVDSMFVYNSIGVGGSDLKRAVNIFPKEQLILVFDNEPRNKVIVDIMQRMIHYDYKIVIWPNSWKYKDINEAIMNGVSKQEISSILYKNAHKKLSLKLAIRDWKKC